MDETRGNHLPVGNAALQATSAMAIAAPGFLVALAADLPSAAIPAMTGVFVWASLIPTVPVMLLGQVWLYRMTRRSAGAVTFFACGRLAEFPAHRGYDCRTAVDHGE